jgi:hypothetical protein
VNVETGTTIVVVGADEAPEILACEDLCSVADNPLDCGTPEELSPTWVVEALGTGIETRLEEVGIAPEEEGEHELRWGRGLEMWLHCG